MAHATQFVEKFYFTIWKVAGQKYYLNQAFFKLQYCTEPTASKTCDLSLKHAKRLGAVWSWARNATSKGDGGDSDWNVYQVFQLAKISAE